MMKLNYHYFSIFLILSGLHWGCAPDHNSNETETQKIENKKTLQDLRDNTENLSQKIEALESQQTNNSKVTIFHRFEVSIEEVFISQGIQNKLVTAHQYFSNFESQRIYGDKKNPDFLTTLNLIKRREIRDFFAGIKSLIGNDFDIEVPRLSKKWKAVNSSNNSDFDKWLTLGALAIGMSHSYENPLLSKENISNRNNSVYEDIKQALQSKQKFENGEFLEEYLVEILRYENEAVFLLQLRHNMLALQVASELERGDSDIWTRFWIYDWSVDPVKLGKALIISIEELVNAGSETQIFLKDHGYKIEQSQQVQKIFQKLIWVTENNKPYERLINQLGMVPWLDQVDKFKFKLNAQTVNLSDPERLIVKTNSLTGSTLFIFNVCQYREEVLKAHRKPPSKSP